MATPSKASSAAIPAEMVAYIDGGSRGNPGPAGYGVWIRDGNGQTIETLSGFLGETTNNVAEYQGLLAALEYATTHGAKRLAIYCDSELIARQMQGRYRVQSRDLKPLFERAQTLARRLAQFSIEHIPREENSFADRLANEAMDQMDQKDSPAPPTLAFTAVVTGGKLQPLPPLPHLEEGAEYEVRARRRMKPGRKGRTEEA